MKHIELTEEDKMVLARCLTEGEEPSPELAKKLFPSQFTHDFKVLHDARIPTIEYAGKRPEAAILSEASVMGAACPLQLERCFDGGKINKKINQLMLFKESAPEYEAGLSACDHAQAGWRNLIVQGDNLQFLKTCYLNQDPIIKDKVKGKVKLVYIDPPFATKGDFSAGDGEDSYSDRVDRAEFIEQVRERLIYMRELLHDTGAVYVHLDQRMSAHMRVVLDEVFGRDGFRNEIVWRNTNSHNSATTQLGPIHQTILFYSKTKNFTLHPGMRPYSRRYIESRFKYSDERGTYQTNYLTGPGLRAGESGQMWGGYNPSAGGRHWAVPSQIKQYLTDGGAGLCVHETLDALLATGLILFPKKKGGQPMYKQYIGKGTFYQDLWAYQPNTQGVLHESDECIDQDVKWLEQEDELTGYPTQKPEGLLARIIRTSTDPGDLVMDVFGGSGTTAAVAEKLGRRWITCDFGKHAVYTMQKRICLISESHKLGLKDSKKKQAYGDPPKPFAVVSVGAFDFAKIMNLRQNQDAYISFVLGIFGLSERDESLPKKYNIEHVCALKDGSPVEIYPVWNDEYLKEVRVDMDYLQGIIDQAGGKLKGDYYIIAPETCVRVGETKISMGKNRSVTFKPLTFPYKVLEEVARNFSIEEQPSTSDNINKLISSVGFYFNEEVKLSVKKTKKGFKVTEFGTSILDQEEQRYKGLDGLAMLLIDTDYDEERGFTVDTVVYQKDIKDDEVAAKDVNGKTRVIAIDKYGNESGITALKK